MHTLPVEKIHWLGERQLKLITIPDEFYELRNEKQIFIFYWAVKRKGYQSTEWLCTSSHNYFFLRKQNKIKYTKFPWRKICGFISIWQKTSHWNAQIERGSETGICGLSEHQRASRKLVWLLGILVWRLFTSERHDCKWEKNFQAKQIQQYWYFLSDMKRDKNVHKTLLWLSPRTFGWEPIHKTLV